MWLSLQKGATNLGEKKNGFLVSANPTDHPKHQRDLLSRMPVAAELAKVTDAAAAEAHLSDFDLARAAKVARDQGLDPRHALTAGFDDDMATALETFRDRVVDVAKALNAGGCLSSTLTPKSRPSKRPRPSSPPGSPSAAPRNAPAATGAAPPSAPSSGTGAAFMTTWGPNASLPVQLAAAAREGA